MADLGSRLLEAGLCTRAQLARALETAPPNGAALLRQLCAAGVEEDAIAGYFLASGAGPLLEPDALDGAEGAAVALLSAPIAMALLALPVRSSSRGLVVAMADPTDAHAVAELEHAVGRPILPRVARLSELTAALEKHEPALARPVSVHPDGTHDPDPSAVLPLDDPPLPLVRPKTPAAPVGRSFPRPHERGPRRKRTHDFAAPEPQEPRPRKRTHDFAPPSPAPASSAARRRGGVETRAQRGVSSGGPPPGVAWRGGAPPSPTEDLWDLPAPSPRAEPSVIIDELPLSRRLRRSLRAPPPPGAAEPGLTEIGPILAGIRAARKREEVEKLACRGAATVGRCAVLLGLSRGILRGLAAEGGGLGHAAVRNLRIPARAESIFRDVVSRGEEYLGPHGPSPADTVFRATIGGRGGDVLLVPIVLSGKAAAVLCVDGLRFGERGRERAEVLAHAVGDAFERIILLKKTAS